jgi:Na+/H+ antiporter NhaC
VNRPYFIPNKKDVLKVKKSANKMGTLVGLTNLAIANNTVSIVITGTIAKEINDEYDLNPRKQQRY